MISFILKPQKSNDSPNSMRTRSRYKMDMDHHKMMLTTVELPK